jgi:DNA-binding NarL/FixJ family response regulator
VISLAATGLDAPEIAKQLSLAAVTIRQELSKAYKILVPNPKPGTDLRTSAVLRYLRETREL